jgi:hypothetical protein
MRNAFTPLARARFKDRPFAVKNVPPLPRDREREEVLGCVLVSILGARRSIKGRPPNKGMFSALTVILVLKKQTRYDKISLNRRRQIAVLPAIGHREQSAHYSPETLIVIVEDR